MPECGTAVVMRKGNRMSGDASIRTASTSGSDPHRRLTLAGTANHRSMFATQALAAGGSAEARYGGVVVYRPGAEVLVGFPDVPPDDASDFADEIVAFARERRPLGQVGWWTMDEASSAQLGVPLLARGFQWGWRPYWMALDPAHLDAGHPRPASLLVMEIDKDTGRDLVGLPYQPDLGTTFSSLRYFAAFLDGAGVGIVMLHLSEFEGEAVGGIYGTEVLEAARGQGVGTALTVAASRCAREVGCTRVLLNSTPWAVSVYRRAGFTALGEAGQTWWMPEANLQAAPPSRHTVALIEAVGAGDVSAVRAALEAEPVHHEAKLACDRTLVEVAELVGQPAMAQWLRTHQS